MSALGLKGPRRALYIVCGPTPYHPHYPLLGFRVPFFFKHAADSRGYAQRLGERAAAGGTRSAIGVQIAFGSTGAAREHTMGGGWVYVAKLT